MTDRDRAKAADVALGRRAVGRLRIAAALIALGYGALGASLFFRHAVALTVLIPAGAALIVVGIVLWLTVVAADARSKGMV